MVKQAPKLIRINPDDYHLKYVGRTVDKRQFFLTRPFVPTRNGDPGREFLALYIFDADGVLLAAKIDDLGTRERPDDNFERSLVEKRLAELGEVSFRFIKVAPFRVEKFGVEFGLIAQTPEDDEEEWTVVAEPGNYLSFYPPWNGDYDT